MKYIRTKDRVSLLRQPIAMEKRYVVKDSDDSFEVVIDEETLLKRYRVADTIEELCDLFVLIENFEDKIFHSLNYTLCDDLRNNKNNKGIYGAIWTEKGLIYVAKLNDGGVLELC